MLQSSRLILLLLHGVFGVSRRSCACSYAKTRHINRCHHDSNAQRCFLSICYGKAYYDYYRRTQAKRVAKQRPAEHSAGEDAAGSIPGRPTDVVPLVELAPHDVPLAESYEQRPPRGPDHIEVARAIFAYAKRIGHPRLQIGDIVIEAGRGWMGFVYSPKVTWEQRLQVYQYVLASPDGEPSA
jgi:hypothetical protein